MNFLDTLDSQLVAAAPDWIAVRQAVNTARKSILSSRDQVVLGVVERLCLAFQDEALTDAIVLLRQLIRLRGLIRLSAPLWERTRMRAEICGLVGIAGEDGIEVSARPWRSTWLRYSEQMDTFESRSNHPSSLGDGMLNAMRPAWTNYRSEAQKAAVDAWLFAPPGSTTLVTLPTGGGKSMCTILPAWFSSRGGRVNSGTTLVVVPTVALAFDQQKQAESFFRGSARPKSRTGSNNFYERMEIEADLRDGALPILFISPESLLNSRLQEACLEAAANGLITRFVIDEAHLVESWGAGFRPEFQYLSTFRRRMLHQSKGSLRTLLLSATISERSLEVLEQLFSELGQLITIQANRLRPEIGYWFDIASNEYIRNKRVLEALQFLPRPLILYVTQPQQAEAWYKRLTDEGYQRVTTFTGDTQGDERQARLDAWMSNQIDIMIGTSAFGLGVDKSDVRAIVHATLPENIDRFYQEVGRGGRDGYSAVSLLCTCPQDEDLAYSLSPKRITFEKAEPRWRAMLATANNVTAGDMRCINRDAVPIGKHRNAVEIDRDWNGHILLLLQRAHVIEVVDVPSPDFDQLDTSEADLLIRVLEPRILDDPDYFRVVFEHAREQEMDYHPTEKLMGIVDIYSGDDAADCIGCQFAAIYDDVQIACGGCAYCRREQQSAFGGDTLDYQITYPASLAAQLKAEAPLSRTLQNKLGAWKSLNVTWTGARTLDSLSELLEIAPLLAKHGVQQFVIPDGLFEQHDLGESLVRALAEQDQEYNVFPHRLIPVSWVTDSERTPLLPLSTVIFYPPDDRTANRIYERLKAGESKGIHLPACIHVVHTSLRLTNVGKLFTQHVDGLNEPFDTFQKFLRGNRR